MNKPPFRQHQMPSTIEKSIFSSGGKTFIGISGDGTQLYAVNKHGLTKSLQLDKPEEEPDVLETCKDPTSLEILSNSKCIIASLKGDVHLHDSRDSNSRLLLRCALPVRDAVLVHNGKTVAVGGDDLELSLIALSDDAQNSKVTVKLEDQVRQLSYNQHMSILAVSQVNGNIHFYSMTSTTPRHVRKLEGYIDSHFYDDTFGDQLLQAIDPTESSDDLNSTSNDPEYCEDNRVCVRVEWHPQGMHFAIPCRDKCVKIFSLKDYSPIKTLISPNIKKSIVDLKYSPQTGAYVAAIDLHLSLIHI